MEEEVDRPPVLYTTQELKDKMIQVLTIYISRTKYLHEIPARKEALCWYEKNVEDV